VLDEEFELAFFLERAEKHRIAEIQAGRREITLQGRSDAGGGGNGTRMQGRLHGRVLCLASHHAGKHQTEGEGGEFHAALRVGYTDF